MYTFPVPGRFLREVVSVFGIGLFLATWHLAKLGLVPQKVIAHNHLIVSAYTGPKTQHLKIRCQRYLHLCISFTLAELPIEIQRSHIVTVQTNSLRHGMSTTYFELFLWKV